MPESKQENPPVSRPQLGVIYPNGLPTGKAAPPEANNQPVATETDPNEQTPAQEQQSQPVQPSDASNRVDSGHQSQPFGFCEIGESGETMPNEPKFKSVTIFTHCFEGLGVALRLKADGETVTMAVIEDRDDILTPFELDGGNKSKENPKDRKKRLEIGNGLIDKEKADKAVKRLLAIPEADRQDHFVFADMNACWKFTEQLAGKGFPGLLPTLEDRMLEIDRKAGKERVAKSCPDLTIGEVHEFKTVDEAKAFLEAEGDGRIFCLKGYADDCETVVPDEANIPHPELLKANIIAALDAGRDKYESGGFELEEFIEDGIEWTPELNIIDGRPVWALNCLELKRFGAGDTGHLVGCAADLVYEMGLDHWLLSKCFTPELLADYENRQGWCVIDAALLYSPRRNKLFFLESCSNRKGWNSFVTELATVPSVGQYFRDIADGLNPLDRKFASFGASVRLFNVKCKTLGVQWLAERTGDVWPMELTKTKDMVSLNGYDMDVMMVTGSGESVEEAAADCYGNVACVNVPRAEYRPLEDYLSTNYRNSIRNRFEALESGEAEQAEPGGGEMNKE